MQSMTVVKNIFLSEFTQGALCASPRGMIRQKYPRADRVNAHVSWSKTKTSVTFCKKDTLLGIGILQFWALKPEIFGNESFTKNMKLLDSTKTFI